jgi:hypothetical protein
LAPYCRLVLFFALGDGCVQAPVQKRIICRVISLIIAVCCRRISAVQKPRAAPAQALAALSQRLIQGLGMELPPRHEEENRRCGATFRVFSKHPPSMASQPWL